MKTIKSGILPSFNKKFFQPIELYIIKLFAKYWQITSGAPVKIGRSYYNAVFMKPTSFYSEMFNIDREIILLISVYKDYKKDIDAINEIRTTYQALRFEEICSVIVSVNDNIEEEVNSFLKSNKESQIIIPFSINELKKNSKKEDYIINKFRKHFYSRDLFAYKSALQRELYFFGRTEIVYKLMNRHLSFENSGIFGLRKTGKTSVLYAVQRALKLKEGISVWIDCQDTSVYLRRWNQVLFFIIKELYESYNLKLASTENSYEPAYASEQFSSDMKKAYTDLGGKPILIIFDEVERITFDISDEEHWRTGEDFIPFWRTLRANFQKMKNVFSYLIASTNPKCVETVSINGSENPIFAQIPYFYIEQFGVKETKEMVKKLGGYMGILFEEEIYAYLTRDFGGHPFLIRHICSTIHEDDATSKRPFIVKRKYYDDIKDKFEIEKSHEYSKMILEVLEKYYEDEYEMLRNLALGNLDFFNTFVTESPEYTNHLIGYGILEVYKNDYDFKIDTLKNYILSKNKYKKLKLTIQEKRKEVSERRNNIEPKLRTIIRRQLKVQYGEEIAKKKVLRYLNLDGKPEYKSVDYKDLFNGGNKSKILFREAAELMLKNWEKCFRNILDIDVEKFKSKMVLINYLRRGDTHAAKMSDEEMQVSFTFT